MRLLLKAVLERANYDVLECATALEFAAQLDAARLGQAQPILFALNVELTASSMSRVDQLVRGHRHSSGVFVILICEFGAVDRVPVMESGPLLGLLEKPFDLDEFEILAWACSAMIEEASANGLVNEMSETVRILQ